MKKYSTIVLAVALIFGMLGSASAIVITDTQMINKKLRGNSSVRWTHLTPTDLEVPFDTVNSATVEIFACGVAEGNDQILVDGSYVGTLENRSWTWVSTGFLQGYLNIKGAAYDIANIFTPTWEAESFDVIINANEFYTNWWGKVKKDSFWVNKSIFTIDYDNGYGPGPAPVPEPATMLLLGTGLAGMAVARSRKGKKE